MRLTASDFYTLLRGTRCERRVFLDHHATETVDAGEFEQLLLDLGQRHETEHLKSFDEVLDLGELETDEAVAATLHAIASDAQLIYQPAFAANLNVDGEDLRVVGRPDFLMSTDAGDRIRDAKLSRRINDSDHPEIIRTLELYGWLYEQTVGQAPLALEVFAGDHTIVEVPYYDGAATARALLAEIARLKAAGAEPWSPVGWSKCEPCAFRPHCWDPAVDDGHAAVLPEVDQGLATALRDDGVQTIEDLIGAFDVDRLAEYRRPQGTQLRKVGKRAVSILDHATAWISGSPIVLGPAAVPDAEHFVMFDLEGIPPFADDLERIYLWGFGVYGPDQSDYRGVAANAEEGGDERAWWAFLDGAADVFAHYGDISWVHWASYEKTYLRKYIDRFGDPDGVAARVVVSLHDLLRTTRAAVVLPVPSYSLKVIEQQAGFVRSQEDFGGAWSIATYIEAVETNDHHVQQGLVGDLLTYNEDDLDATWAVLQWLKGLTAVP